MTVPLLVRPRVSALFDAGADAPITLVSGMAGAGKSTAVRQWLESRGGRHAWLDLAVLAQDPVRFWGEFSAALVVAWAFDGVPDADAFDDLAGLVIPDSLTVVLDDVHFAVGTPLFAQLAVLLRSLPHGVSIVLVSRSRPSLGLSRLSAEGLVHEVDAESLAFTRAEIAEFLDADAETADAVAGFTRGWPIAVAFSRSLGATTGAVATEWAGPRRAVAEFLAEEVVSSLPDDLAVVAREASVLDVVTTEVVGDVLEIADAGERLARLSSLTPILAPVEGGWVMHAVVRDAFIAELLRRSPERVRELHARASGFFETRDIAAAISHALEAEAPERAVALLEQNLIRLQHVPYSTQLLWLLALSDGAIGAHPALSAHAALVAAYERRFELAESWLSDRETSTPTTLDELGARTMRFVLLGDLPRLREPAQRLLAEVTEESTLWALAHGALTGALRSTGDFEGALAVMLSMFRGRDSVSEPLLLLQSSARACAVRLFLDLGKAHQAQAALAELRDWVEGLADASGLDRAYLAWAEAMVALEEGGVAAAGAWSEPPRPALSLGLPFYEVWLQLDFARVRAAVGDDRAARRALYRVQSLLGRFADAGL
ncbi:MAG TPA: hypothetical protein PK890_04375, partial [Terrimesophilobacter sp.]|nr:hypothetical protein [Terrimesophilobacter sp.]